MNESDPSNSGGAAPEDRQCRYTKSDGQPCHDWAVRGQDYCHRHDLFLHRRPERPIDVPLLEDEASIVLLLSETLRAMAWGTLPVSNGRIMLQGCRLAHTIQLQRVESAKLRLRARRLGIPEHEIFDPPNDSQRKTNSAESVPVPGTPCPAPDVPCPAPADEPLTTPVLQPPDQRYHTFRDRKKDWDKELLRCGNAIDDMHVKRYGESREDFLAARATPFENLAAEDQALQQEIARGAALLALKNADPLPANN